MYVDVQMLVLENKRKEEHQWRPAALRGIFTDIVTLPSVSVSVCRMSGHMTWLVLKADSLITAWTAGVRPAHETQMLMCVCVNTHSICPENSSKQTAWITGPFVHHSGSQLHWCCCSDVRSTPEGKWNDVIWCNYIYIVWMRTCKFIFGFFLVSEGHWSQFVIRLSSGFFL